MERNIVEHGRNAVGEAYAFFDCNASPAQIKKELPSIRKAVNSPSELKLRLYEHPGLLISVPALSKPEIQRGIEEEFGAIRYALLARLPNSTDRQTADELSAIMNQAYQSRLYGKGEEFRGAIIYADPDSGEYIFRE